MPAARPLVSLIVAMANNRVIGRGNALPWRLPSDLKRFRALTLGKPVLMGRGTFESIGRPLTGRVNLVLTRAAGWAAEGTLTVRTLAEALERASDSPELVVIGGAQVYALALPTARRIYLTHVHAEVPGDTFFPAFEPGEWRDVESSAQPADERHAYPLTFVTLERRAAPGER
ncbi:MAG: type 3 dihydrofolate reductase [Steroidobacteraceae bacterium]